MASKRKTAGSESDGETSEFDLNVPVIKRRKTEGMMGASQKDKDRSKALLQDFGEVVGLIQRAQKDMKLVESVDSHIHQAHEEMLDFENDISRKLNGSKRCTVPLNELPRTQWQTLVKKINAADNEMEVAQIGEDLRRNVILDIGLFATKCRVKLAKLSNSVHEKRMRIGGPVWPEKVEELPAIYQPENDQTRKAATAQLESIKICVLEIIDEYRKLAAQMDKSVKATEKKLGITEFDDLEREDERWDTVDEIDQQLLILGAIHEQLDLRDGDLIDFEAWQKVRGMFAVELWDQLAAQAQKLADTCKADVEAADARLPGLRRG